MEGGGGVEEAGDGAWSCTAEVGHGMDKGGEGGRYLGVRRLPWGGYLSSML